MPATPPGYSGGPGFAKPVGRRARFDVMSNPSGLRISDAERDQAAADLRDHYAVVSEAGTVTPLPLRSGP